MYTTTESEAAPANSSRAASGWIYYALSVATLLTSLAVAVRLYPGIFDWQYTVISALASSKHNPQGGVWFAGGLGIAMVWLWPFVNRFLSETGSTSGTERRSVVALRCGIVFGGAMAIESIISPELPQPLAKTHEALALFAFLFFYSGILGLSLHNIRRDKAFIWPSILVVLPLVAIGVSQLTLYLGQRDLGWVDRSWREMGVPVWQSFAFWQWLALAFLWIGLGCVGWMNRHRG